MTGTYLTSLANVIRATGVPVVEQDGWKTRARSSGGYAAGRPWCVMWHHTASSPNASAKSDTDYMSYNADAKPIANIMLDRTGVAWVLAAGCTNTNGKGNPQTFSKGTVPADSMNTYAIGMEIQNSGVGEPYSQACIDNAFTISIALCKAYGMAVDDVSVHSVYSVGRKIDPAISGAVQGPWQPRSTNTSGSWNLDDLKAELRRRAAPAPLPPDPDPEEDEDMPFIITNKDTGQPALVYGAGKVTGLDGGCVGEFTVRYGSPIVVEAATFNDFASKGG